MVEYVGIQRALNIMAGTDGLGSQGAATIAANAFNSIGRQRKYVTQTWHGPANHTLSTNAAGLNVMTMIPFWVGTAFTADRIGVEPTATAATSVTRLGIYQPNSSDIPATLLLDAGTVDSSSASGSAGVAATINYTFAPGLYYLAAVGQTASPTLRSVNSYLYPVSVTSAGSIFGSSTNNCYFKSSISGALADVATPSVGAGGYLVKVRAA